MYLESVKLFTNLKFWKDVLVYSFSILTILQILLCIFPLSADFSVAWCIIFFYKIRSLLCSYRWVGFVQLLCCLFSGIHFIIRVMFSCNCSWFIYFVIEYIVASTWLGKYLCISFYRLFLEYRLFYICWSIWRFFFVGFYSSVGCVCKFRLKSFVLRE